MVSTSDLEDLEGIISLNGEMGRMKLIKIPWICKELIVPVFYQDLFVTNDFIQYR